MEQAETYRLCLKARDGDSVAMEQLLHQYRPLMVSVARRWPVCGFDDALQEAHVAAMEAAQLFDPGEGCYFGAFLRQRIRAHLRTWGRRQVRWSERNVAASSGRDGEDDVLPVEDWADDKVSPGTLGLQWEGWMAGLSVRERLVIERQIVEGYTLREIAAQESVSPHTVHTWKKRAMKKLRDRLSPIGQSGGNV